MFFEIVRFNNHCFETRFIVIDNRTAFFGSLGLPGWFAYVTILWEIIGAVALIIGVYPRVAAAALIPILLGAIVTVHGAAGFFFTNANGGWEFPAFWIVGLAVVALAGNGAFALKPGASAN